MKEEYRHWYSPSLSRDIEMLVFGHAGWPVMLFPTSKGRYYQNKDFGLIESVRWFIEQGKVRIYCPDSIDELSWYNKDIHPAERAQNHMWYDRMLREELAPRMLQETGYGKLIAAGCSFGAYYAANFAFRYPELTAYMFAMGGAFDISPQTDGYSDDTIYYHNPTAFLPNLQHPDLWQMGIVLGVGEHDFCRPANEQLSQQLAHKNVNHWLDIRQGYDHDWPVWREMFPHYLSQL